MSASAPAPRSRHWARRALTSASTAAVLTVAAASTAMAEVPKPVATQPPGTEGLNTILNWIAWGVAAACVVGILIVAGMMAIKHRRNEGAESLSGLGMVLTACVVAAAGSSLVGALIK